ncbi:MAG: hypothetical protein ABIR78_13815 [Ferruginibacter sp.]
MPHKINAQQSDTIYVEYKKNVQVIFNSPIIEYDFISQPNASDYFDVKKTKENRSLTIVAKLENTPISTYTIKETNGTTTVLIIKYKKDIDVEYVYDFTDNVTENKFGIKNTVLTQTDDKIPSKTQDNAIPGTEISQLSAANPGIDFFTDPPEQTRNLAGTDIPQAFIDSVYSRKRGSLNRAYKDRDDVIKIRLICEDIIFSGTNAYLKLLIQNDGDEAFFTGNMILKLVRNNGSLLSLHPGDIFPKKFPVIKSKFQIAIIYSFKAYEVLNEDNLKFEIHDRKQKINLEFTIPGSVYNEAKKN